MARFVFLSLVVLALLFLSSSASAVCICTGGPLSESCKACGSGAKSDVVYYTFKKGQLLSEIAAECGVDTESIKQANGLGPSSSIKIGQVLKVPGGSCGSGSSGSVNSAVASSSNLAWPTPCCASWYSPFGVPRSGGRTHKGLDIGHPSGTPVFAPANGVIAKAVTRDVGLCGLRAHIRLDSGQFILNCHMNSVDVRAGQRVSKCQKLGTVGKTGNARSTPPHDHFEIRVGGVAKNPLPILKRADEYCA